MKSGQVPIHSVVRPVESWNPSRADPDESFSYIDLGSVDQERKVITEAKETRCGDAPSRARQLVKASDILVSTVRPNLNGVAQVSPDLDGATASTGFCVLRPDSAKVEPRYLMQWVKSPAFIDDMVRKATGASYPAVSDRIVEDSLFPLPPLAEQRRIADILDRADDLRAKRRVALARLDELTHAIFVVMLGDPAVNPMRWPVRTVGSLACKFSDGPFGSNLKSSHYVESGIRVIRLQNIGVGRFVDDDSAYISTEHFEALAKHECRPGDVLIGTLGDPNLRACLQPQWLPVALNKADCVQLRADESVALPRYVSALLNHPSVERMAQSLMLGQTRVRISMGRLRDLNVPVAPLAIQRRYVEIEESIDDLRSQHDRSALHADSLFASLQDRAFRGTL